MGETRDVFSKTSRLEGDKLLGVINVRTSCDKVTLRKWVNWEEWYKAWKMGPSILSLGYTIASFVRFRSRDHVNNNDAEYIDVWKLGFEPVKCSFKNSKKISTPTLSYDNPIVPRERDKSPALSLKLTSACTVAFTATVSGRHQSISASSKQSLWRSSVAVVYNLHS